MPSTHSIDPSSSSSDKVQDLLEYHRTSEMPLTQTPLIDIYMCAWKVGVRVRGISDYYCMNIGSGQYFILVLDQSCYKICTSRA